MEAIAHDLAREFLFDRKAQRPHLTHRDLGFVVRGGGHIQSDKIEEPVVVDIAGIRAHREPRGVVDHAGDDIGEGAIAIVAKEIVGVGKVVGDVDVDEAVVVEVEPSGGESVALFLNASGFADVGEFSAVIAKEDIGSADVIDFVRSRSCLFERVVFFELCFDDDFPVGKFFYRLISGASVFAVVTIGDEPDVEVAVAIKVAKARHETGVDLSEAEVSGRFAKFSRAVVEEKGIRRVIIAKVEVEIAIVVDIDGGGSGAPVVFAAFDSCRSRDIFEGEIAGLAIESITFGAASEEEVGFLISVEVADGDPSASEAGVIKAVQRVIENERVVVSKAAGGGRNFGEERVTQARLSRDEGEGDDLEVGKSQIVGMGEFQR